MYNPVSTYRIQFNKKFSFDDLEKIIPYLQKLGISTIYASPIFEAAPESVHGYDLTNPHVINPEIGTKEQLENISKKLKETSIGWLQDIVPNHMAFHPKNKWLMDVLEKGRHSVYASFFDIIWNSKVHNGKLMVPFLGGKPEETINKGEIKLVFEKDGIHIKYHDGYYPIRPESYTRLFNQKRIIDKPLKQALKQIAELTSIENTVAYVQKWNGIKWQLLNNDFLQDAIKNVNSNYALLFKTITEQHYRLCHWQETDRRINFRRFFTINGLICLNMQDQNVFEYYHQLIKQLLDAGIFNGLRVDHIDGLYDPATYLDQLRELSGEESYITVEKILEPGESLPDEWDVGGNTGYDFLSLVNNLLTNKKAETAFTQFYKQLTKDKRSIHQHLHDKKANILYHYMAGELENLCQLFKELKLMDKRDKALIHPDDLKTAIAEFLIQCPVYRYYGNRFPLSHPESLFVQNILNRMKDSGAADEKAIAVLEKIFLQIPGEENEDFNTRVARFYQRCMQFTGPLMAKGVEDTLLYTYHRFIGHNEVGDSPEAFGISSGEFHRAMIERQEDWPLSLNATSTHDTKRGEDTRARLNVLTDFGEEWLQLVEEWQKTAKSYRQKNYPDKNDEYLVYQSLVGHYPMPGQEEDLFEERFSAYLQKALREAKQHSNWTKPNEEYEKATIVFAKKLLNKNEAFWKSFVKFHSKIADYGIINSLSQVLLKFTCPGVPDTYQGCELWDFSFVDPDNRRPINYEQRTNWLNEFEHADTNILDQLWNERYSGKIKLWLVHQLLQWRKENADFLRQAEYIPLSISGTYKNHVLAFARKHKQRLYIIVLPLHLAELGKIQEKNLREIDWKDTTVYLPGKIVGEIENIFTKNRLEKSIEVKEIFTQFPIGLLKAEQEENTRGAGILLHITSLPSPFEIGDMGPEAKVFAGFLYRNKQRYWQLLPVNPTEGGQGHSPYSAISGMAGNPLLISPELLAKEKLLDTNELQQYHQPCNGRTDFKKAEEIKNILLEKAYQNFRSGNFPQLQKEFERFCEKEKEWLPDFVLYTVLKKQNKGKPWYEWPLELKQRLKNALEKPASAKHEEINKAKWIQFIFFRQWHNLKEYCNNLNIQIIGDMPFYVSYDSADVWSNQEIFALDEEGNRTGMAGVPPDAFSADGQLWGMPVFKWDVLKEKNYDWWIKRLKKNVELFDIVRLDHFRAFDEYWEVPAGETSAKKGQWKPGPGKDFFQLAKKQLGELPFIAEDLGEITSSVYQLRDEFNLPGMKVLQFAFGRNMPYSPHINHLHQYNFIVYTGTHDNNTSLGWYRTEADETNKKNLESYLGKTLNENEIHKEMSRLAYSSTAKTAILLMQDILGLNENARMNKPSSQNNNWNWRLVPEQLSADAGRLLKEWTFIYGR